MSRCTKNKRCGQNRKETKNYTLFFNPSYTMLHLCFTHFTSIFPISTSFSYITSHISLSPPLFDPSKLFQKKKPASILLILLLPMIQFPSQIIHNLQRLCTYNRRSNRKAPFAILLLVVLPHLLGPFLLFLRSIH